MANALSLGGLASGLPAASRGALVLVGFMGAGKSSAARVAAADLRARPTDADEELERALGCTIEDFFAAHGEPEFRAREEDLVCALLERPPGPVLALGGGAIESERVRAALGAHTVAWLEVDAETAWHRAGGRGRPLARDRRRFDELHERREPLYEQVADAVIPSRDRETVRRGLAAVGLLASAPDGTRLAWAGGEGGQYPVLAGDGLLGAGWWPVAGRRFVVSDETVDALLGDGLGHVDHRLRGNDVLALGGRPRGDEPRCHPPVLLPVGRLHVDD